MGGADGESTLGLLEETGVEQLLNIRRRAECANPAIEIDIHLGCVVQRGSGFARLEEVLIVLERHQLDAFERDGVVEDIQGLGGNIGALFAMGQPELGRLKPGPRKRPHIIGALANGLAAKRNRIGDQARGLDAAEAVVVPRWASRKAQQRDRDLDMGRVKGLQ